MSSWARLNSDYVRHPKVIRLCALLKDPEGDRYLPRLLAWCAGNCENGTLPLEMARDDFEAACRWRGKRGQLFELLVEVRLVDVTAETASVHDWEAMNGAHIREIRRDRERKRTYSQSPNGNSGGNTNGVSTGVSEARSVGRSNSVSETFSALPSTPLPPSRGARKRRARVEETERPDGMRYANGVPAVDRLRPGNAGEGRVIHLGTQEASDWLDADPIPKANP